VLARRRKKFATSLGFLGACVATVPNMIMTIDDAPYGVEIVSPVLYGQAPGQPVWEGGLYLDLMLPTPRPAEASAVVLYLHHGGWRAGDRSYGMYPWNGPVLAAHGFVVASASYRFSSVAAFPAQLHDAKAAVRWLRAHAAAYGTDPDRIGVMGDSSGGQLAGLLGTTADRPDLEGDCGYPGWSSSVQAVVARCAPTDFGSLPQDAAEVLDPLFGGPPATTAELRQLASPLTHVSSQSAPFLIVHGTRDETVLFDQAQRMARKLDAHGVSVTLHAIDGGYHNLLPDIDPPWGSEPWTGLGWLALDFFRRTLERAGSMRH
jgi:acetyl esterase/lipase